MLDDRVFLFISQLNLHGDKYDVMFWFGAALVQPSANLIASHFELIGL